MNSPQPILPENILDVQSLSVDYGSTKAVDNVAFQIRAGEIFGLLGPNGAGKTSILSSIEGLIKPTTGKIVVVGIDAATKPFLAKKRMGIQLQATSFQDELSIKQIVRLYSGLYGIKLSSEQIIEKLDDIGLARESPKRFKQLSGGQQQRLGLLIAIIHNPALLLLDEPTSGLDPQSRRQLWGKIEHLRSIGGSILLTTHSMEEAQAVCDRVAIINQGKLLACDTPSGLIEQNKNDVRVRSVARGEITLEDVFIGLTGADLRD